MVSFCRKPISNFRSQYYIGGFILERVSSKKYHYKDYRIQPSESTPTSLGFGLKRLFLLIFLYLSPSSIDILLYKSKCILWSYFSTFNQRLKKSLNFRMRLKWLYVSLHKHFYRNLLSNIYQLLSILSLRDSEHISQYSPDDGGFVSKRNHYTEVWLHYLELFSW